ncbi:RNA pyrophosphohydrolase [Altererythrobacter sp. GH1-8]|uniref:RNA pyrophosphohydrolase n=1 Tax=Altererythrobacter sp. GH1-8 TaxID=3349333 RepID=UPI00374CC9E9
MTELPTAYRPCAGFMLINAHRRVFVGQRIDSKDNGAWQMPQGGIDPGEDHEQAALRELYEETGIGPSLVTVLRRMREPVRYDLPSELMGKLWGGKYRGQEQFWFLGRYEGRDEDIDITAHHPPEFAAWQWANPVDLPELIVPFKRHVYRAVLEEFRELLYL